MRWTSMRQWSFMIKWTSMINDYVSVYVYNSVSVYKTVVVYELVNVYEYWIPTMQSLNEWGSMRYFGTKKTVRKVWESGRICRSLIKGHILAKLFFAKWLLFPID